MGTIMIKIIVQQIQIEIKRADDFAIQIQMAKVMIQIKI